MYKTKIKKSFNQAAATYNSLTMLQKNVAAKLVDDIVYPHINIKSIKSIFDLGSGTGYCCEYLGRYFKDSSYFLIDIAQQMLKTAKQYPPLTMANFICADIDHLPFNNNTADMVISSLALQWSPNLEYSLREIKKILRPNGIFAYAIFTGRTLGGLNTSWRQVDNYRHINSFISAQQLGKLLRQTGFTNLNIETQTIIHPYHNVFELLKTLQRIGSVNANQQYNKKLTGKGILEKLTEYYPYKDEKNSNIMEIFEVTFGYVRG